MSVAAFAFLFESLKPFCTTLLYAASFTMIKEETPNAVVATVNAVFGALYFGVGRGVGGLLGGLGMERAGARVTFRAFGFASAGCAAMFAGAVLVARCNRK